MVPIADYLHGLIDDAAIFPPGELPLPEAVPAHTDHQRAWYAPLIGPFVVTDRHVDLLPTLLDTPHTEAPQRDAGLAVSVVASGGAGSIDPTVRSAHATEGVRPVAVEAALQARDDLASAARRVSTMLTMLTDDGLLDDDVTVSIEVPVYESIATSPDWQDAADEIAAGGYQLKFRTGGADADAFPSPLALATAIDAAIDREVPFKCTAGLHHAVPHRDPDTGIDHHGFLAVLLATRACLDGAGATTAAEMLATTTPSALTAAAADVGDNGLASARRWFRSFGSCSVTEPVDDLITLGLLAPPTTDTV